MKQIKQFAAHNFQARSSLHNNMTCDLESHAIAIKRFGVWRDNHTCGVFFSDKPEYAVYIGPEKPSMPNNDSFQNVPKLSVLSVFSAARSIAWSIDFQFMKATFNDVNTSNCPGFNTNGLWSRKKFKCNYEFNLFNNEFNYEFNHNSTSHRRIHQLWWQL